MYSASSSISVYAHINNSQVRDRVICAEGLHFSAFHSHHIYSYVLEHVVCIMIEICARCPFSYENQCSTHRHSIATEGVYVMKVMHIFTFFITRVVGEWNIQLPRWYGSIMQRFIVDWHTMIAVFLEANYVTYTPQHSSNASFPDAMIYGLCNDVEDSISLGTYIHLSDLCRGPACLLSTSCIVLSVIGM